MSKRIATRKPTGAELRAQRDQRLSRPYELQEAGRREASFLKNITGAQDDLEWILTNRAWTQLGFERLADWWEQRVAPATAGFVDLRPSSAMVERVIHAIVADEAELPKAQRRTQREIASIARTSPATVSRSLHVPNVTGDDLDKYSGDVDPSPLDVPGAAGDGLGAEPVPGNPLDPPDRGDQVDESQALPSSDPGPGSSSSLARDEAPPAVGAAQPPALTGEEPVAPVPAAAEEVAVSSAAQNLTDGQTRSLPGNVQPPAKPGVDSAGGTAGEGSQAGTEDPFPADPVHAWMTDWRAFRSAVLALDVDAVRPMLLSYDLDEMGEDWPQMWERLEKLIYP